MLCGGEGRLRLLCCLLCSACLAVCCYFMAAGRGATEVLRVGDTHFIACKAACTYTSAQSLLNCSLGAQTLEPGSSSRS